MSPCLSGEVVCGRDAECTVAFHEARCTCPPGTQGNAQVACISAVCHYNEDCAPNEACDRLNRVCRPVCSEDTCADRANCVAENHEPKCTCFPGTSGNPYVECTGVTDVVRPECVSDSECPVEFACINTKCQNPCLTQNMCSGDQQCRLLNTAPLRTMICECPPNSFTDVNGNCRKIGKDN